MSMMPQPNASFMPVDLLALGECMMALDTPAPLEPMSLMTSEAAGDVYNTLVAASRLGAKTAFCTRLANDAVGQMILSACHGENIDTSGIKVAKDGINGIYLSLHDDVTASHPFIYYRKHSAASQMLPTDIQEAQVKNAKLVYATGISMAISPTAAQSVVRLFELAKKHNVLVAFDPNYRPSLWPHRDEALSALLAVLPYVDILLPSLEDLTQLFGAKPASHLLEFFRYKEVPLVALKDGENGITLARSGKVCHVAATPAPRVVDPVGAGDAFNGAFLYSLLQHRYSLEQCAQIGAQVAASCVAAKGPTRGLPTWDALNAQTSLLNR